MSRPSPTQHEVDMARLGLRAGVDKTPKGVAPPEPEDTEKKVAPVVAHAPSPPPAPPVEHRASDPKPMSQRGGYNTRDTRASAAQTQGPSERE